MQEYSTKGQNCKLRINIIFISKQRLHYILQCSNKKLGVKKYCRLVRRRNSGQKNFPKGRFQHVTIHNGIVGQDYRIRMSIPTIEYLIKRGAIVILASHLGKPIKPDPKYSLRPVAQRLSEIMRANKVMFVNDCVGKIVHEEIDKMKIGEILLLENLRFHKEEESNGVEFSKELSSLADIYVNDAFSVSHENMLQHTEPLSFLMPNYQA